MLIISQNTNVATILKYFFGKAIFHDSISLMQKFVNDPQQISCVTIWHWVDRRVFDMQTIHRGERH